MMIKLKNDADDCHFALFTRSEVTFLNYAVRLLSKRAHAQKFMVRVHIQVQFASFFSFRTATAVAAAAKAFRLTLSLSSTAHIHIALDLRIN